ncbi:LLM class flavin-dependent oxidoreductase [Actinomadura barringtoniae]|uniref:LLM class flavin-dependent oxidoreductase n=1 Tax=Actinomadura barringtoniae TaxID=1427535 RepID=A0A939PAR9_9ACTN|nr:LLM class flavin-dependent oxidoreductase [Actinomadura barringtoniae]MBO2449135.1 LLM class flavin-dependent oxidoreductase [Actinomadura barringtoniae]
MSGAASGPLGLSIASHSGLPPARIGELAGMAERAGFSTVFVAEGHGDALALCPPVIAATSRVEVGTAIVNAALRPPVLAAKTAAVLDDASGGRFALGLGVGNTVMNDRFGLTPPPPLAATEDYVAVVRAVLAGEEHKGEIFRSARIPLDRPPVRPDMPIHLAALGPRMLALAGRIADGVILNLMSPAQAAEATAIVRAAAAEAGRRDTPRILCVVHCCLSEDEEAAAEAARAVVPRYVMHPATDRLFNADLGEARSAVLAGDRTAAARHVPQKVADAFVARGDAAACSARIAEYRAAGVDLPVVFPMPVSGTWDIPRSISGLA